MLVEPVGADGTELDSESPLADGPGGAVSDVAPDPDRKLVIEGNKAWKAASEVRKRWLAANLFTRRTAPHGVARFTAGQLLTMPDPLRVGLAAAPGRPLFSEITGQEAFSWLEICDTAAPGRLPLLMLGPIVTAYEQAMTEGEGKNTWRTDRYSPCPRRDAGQYLTFLSRLGYQLSAIEQAIADGVPYTGDALAGLVPADPGGSGPEGAETDGRDDQGHEESGEAGADGSDDRQDDAPSEAA
jgi:ParB family chromosome partitioning protein